MRPVHGPGAPLQPPLALGPGGPLVPALLLALWALTIQAQAQMQNLTCKPQEGLPLSQPYPPAYFQPSPIPVCSEYSCSCCNRTHGLAIYRAMKAAMDDPTFSRSCLSWQTRMTCRVCDPEVGVGLKPAVCRDTCDSWLAACREEYYTFEPTTPSAFVGRLMPCANPGGATVAAGDKLATATSALPLLCSRLGDVAADGEELCREAGFEVASASDGPCFDGSSSYSTDMCVQPPDRYTDSARRRRAQQKGAGHAGGADERLSPAVYILAVVVVASLVWLSWTTRQGMQVKEHDRNMQLHWRQMQGRTD